MRVTKSLLLGFSTLALATGAAFAGEDSTQRWHGTGPEYHETVGGLNLFSDADSVGSDQFSEPDARLGMAQSDSYDVYVLRPSEPMAQQDYDVYYIYPVEVEDVTLVPSIDTEMPQG